MDKLTICDGLGQPFEVAKGFDGLAYSRSAQGHGCHFNLCPAAFGPRLTGLQPFQRLLSVTWTIDSSAFTFPASWPPGVTHQSLLRTDPACLVSNHVLEYIQEYILK